MQFDPRRLETCWRGVQNVCSVPIVSYYGTEVTCDMFHHHINRHVEWVYKKVGLLSKARLDVKGGRYGRAYGLFKWKNWREAQVVGDVLLTQPKHDKGRPLQPGNLAIDRWIMGRFGKALVWLTSLLPESAMLLHACVDLIPKAQHFREECELQFPEGFTLSHRMFDIAGMYTVLSHSDIVAAVQWLLDVISSVHGAHGHVFHVPVRGKRAPRWGKSLCERGWFDMTFQDVVSLTRVALMTCFCWFGEDCLLQQVLGAPMGLAPSPGFAKCITAKASHAFYMTWCAGVRVLMFGTCFIDDLSVVIAMSVHGDTNMREHVSTMLTRYEHDTYPDGCVLEVDEAGTYLETFMKVVDDELSIIHNSRNTHEMIAEGRRAVVRLHHYDSYVPMQLKLGLVIGHVCRILSNCLIPSEVNGPLLDMLCEYEWLGYPLHVLVTACERVYKRCRHPGLLQVLTSLRYLD